MTRFRLGADCSTPVTDPVTGAEALRYLAILARTGTHNQVDLVALVLGVMRP